MTVIGVDLGGTKIAAGRVSEEAHVEQSVVLPTRASEGFEISLAQLHAAIDAVLSAGVGAIGVAAPGPLDPRTGLIINPPNLPGWRQIALAAMIAERYRLPCRVENDANAAGLAETRWGASRGRRHVFYATISTGIGSGIILDGGIYHGAHGAAGEGGHVTIDWRSPSVCGCGTPGCIEALASGTAIGRRGRPPEDLAADGPLLEEVAQMLAAWLGSVISLLDPEIVVIGGGVSKLGDPLFARLRAEVPRRTINQHAARVPIVPAALGDQGGLLGAAAMMLEKG